MLVQRSRQLKETLLGPALPERLTLSLPWSGSRLIGGARQIEILRSEVYELLVEGFFPCAARRPAQPAAARDFRNSACRSLPIPAVTRYLAAFLRGTGTWPWRTLLPPGRDPARPDIVLFNGGVFESPVLWQRMITCCGRCSAAWNSNTKRKVESR